MKNVNWLVLVGMCLVLGGVATSVQAAAVEDAPERMAQDEDYMAGKKAIDRKDWSRAIQRLQRALVRDPDNADIHNYLGYAHRHVRQMDEALKHYKRALEINPRHRGAHEYIGQAYLMMDDVTSADKHLAALRQICLLPCEEMDDLDRTIKAYRQTVRR
jgi:Flp pilus assembly protein TadD